MAFSAQEFTRELIAYSVITDKDDLIKLLERNGIQIPKDASDEQVTIAVLAASAKSQNFKNELATFLTKEATKAADEFAQFVGDNTDFGFTGLDDFAFTGGDDYFAQTGEKDTRKAKRQAAARTRTAGRVAETNPEGKSAFQIFMDNVKKGLTSEETVNQGINLGLTAINNRIGGRANAIQQEAAIITDKQDQQRQQLARETRTGMTTATWVLIGVGVIALGTVIYFATKKK